MGIFGSLFGGGGGFGADNPEFRNFDEYLGAMTRGGLYGKESPDALKQYFASGAGKAEMNRLGYQDVNKFISDMQGFGPNTASSQQYGDIANQYGDISNFLGGLGGDFNDYGSDFNYSTQDISNIPDQVYQDMLDMQNEQASRGFKGALNQLGARYGAQGFRPGSGLEQASASGLGRNYLEQLSNISRDVGMQRAGSRLDTSKFMSQQDLQRQAMQQQANMQRSNYLTDLQSYARNFGLQNAGMRGNLLTGQQGALQNQTNQALLPYNLGQSYYTGQATNVGPPKSQGIISRVAGGVTDIAKAATAVGGMFA